MPFIHIKSLPFEEQLHIPGIIKNIAVDFSKRTNVQLKHIHSTWEYYKPGHYAKGDETSEFQGRNNYPIIVDLLTPDFNDLNMIAVMLESIADSISEQMGFPKNNIFINHRQANSGMVFDDGSIVKW